MCYYGKFFFCRCGEIIKIIIQGLMYCKKLDINVHTPLFIVAKTFIDLRGHSQNHQTQGLLGIHESIVWSFLMCGGMETETDF